MKFILFAAVVSFAAILFLFAASYLNAKIVGQLFGGDENVAIIANPISVKAWRTVGSLKTKSLRRKDDYYLKSGEAILVSTDLAKQLSKVLLNEHSYGGGKLCAPAPVVVVTFSNGKKDVNIYFCFECDILVVTTDGKSASDRFHLSQGAFDPSRTKLLRIVKKIFPKDPQIQSLDE